MKIIECLNDKISEELSDSESYANLALKYKESDKETAKLFYDLSLEETKHYNKLHDRVVAFTPSDAGVVVVALYKDGNLLPCSVRTMNVNSGVLYMLDAIAPAFEGEACRVIHPEITVQISGVDGTVSRVCLNVTRLA